MSEPVLARLGVLAQQHHHFERHRVVERAQIQPNGPLHLLQPVDKRVAVDVELARSLGKVEAFFYELLDGVEHLVVEQLGRLAVEDLAAVAGADVGGQVVQKALQQQAVVEEDGGGGVVDAADVDGVARLLKALGDEGKEFSTARVSSARASKTASSSSVFISASEWRPTSVSTSFSGSMTPSRMAEASSVEAWAK